MSCSVCFGLHVVLLGCRILTNVFFLRSRVVRSNRSVRVTGLEQVNQSPLPAPKAKFQVVKLLQRKAMSRRHDGDAFVAEQLVYLALHVEAQAAGGLVQEGYPWSMVEHAANGEALEKIFYLENPSNFLLKVT
jgi:hypothetical protein